MLVGNREPSQPLLAWLAHSLSHSASFSDDIHGYITHVHMNEPDHVCFSGSDRQETGHGAHLFYDIIILMHAMYNIDR